MSLHDEAEAVMPGGAGREREPWYSLLRAGGAGDAPDSDAMLASTHWQVGAPTAPCGWRELGGELGENPRLVVQSDLDRFILLCKTLDSLA